MNINPFKYLITPRTLASVIVFPILTSMCRSNRNIRRIHHCSF
nr:ABC transporter permease [Wolbachia endosymbiont of Mansonella ozzardi]